MLFLQFLWSGLCFNWFRDQNRIHQFRCVYQTKRQISTHCSSPINVFIYVTKPIANCEFNFKHLTSVFVLFLSIWINWLYTLRCANVFNQPMQTITSNIGIQLNFCTKLKKLENHFASVNKDIYFVSSYFDAKFPQSSLHVSLSDSL